MGLTGQIIMIIAVVMSTFGSANGSCFTSGRLCFVAAREGHMVDVLSYVHAKKLTPSPALLFNAFIALMMVIPSDIGSLIDFFSFTAWIFYGGAMLALIIMRRTMRDFLALFLCKSSFFSLCPIIYPSLILSLCCSILLLSSPFPSIPPFLILFLPRTFLFSLSFHLLSLVSSLHSPSSDLPPFFSFSPSFLLLLLLSFFSIHYSPLIFLYPLHSPFLSFIPHSLFILPSPRPSSLSFYSLPSLILPPSTSFPLSLLFCIPFQILPHFSPPPHFPFHTIIFLLLPSPHSSFLFPLLFLLLSSLLPRPSPVPFFPCFSFSPPIFTFPTLLFPLTLLLSLYLPSHPSFPLSLFPFLSSFCPSFHVLPPVPIVIPVIVLVISIYLVVGPIIDSPQIEYLYASLFILAGLIFYFPFVFFKKSVPGMGHLTTFFQLILQVVPTDTMPDA
ncbi:B(0,+)-type amino acid transporter 1 [Penaeus vannamei]|uniref:B(0,+)-type amino acid transporter 1 n=1 Tax=Penaeus vannamei TaxID=6689 RepID=A0A3R7PRR0_PENVA|nr:B(0,+)-type amino acid transporter 1 [Penaeus vannamei]